METSRRMMYSSSSPSPFLLPLRPSRHFARGFFNPLLLRDLCDLCVRLFRQPRACEAVADFVRHRKVLMPRQRVGHRDDVQPRRLRRPHARFGVLARVTPAADAPRSANTARYTSGAGLGRATVSTVRTAANAFRNPNRSRPGSTQSAVELLATPSR